MLYFIDFPDVHRLCPMRCKPSARQEPKVNLSCTGVRHMGHSCPSCLRSASLHLLHSTVCLQGSSCTAGGASQHTWWTGGQQAGPCSGRLACSKCTVAQQAITY
jgi:hypothetical protein